ncbi:hypothetical protein PQX77_015013 [Marasmius sp. AFHP31]|nr:hypothetical protein PQX77_015013 [Marasmius sp. AFHP31]
MSLPRLNIFTDRAASSKVKSWQPDPLRGRGSAAAKSLKDTLILVMGPTGSGKTTFINKASGGTLRVGEGLYSCTDLVQESPLFELEGRRVKIFDTPGFDDTTKSDVEIFQMIAYFLADLYQKGHKITGIVYIHRISDVRVGGRSSQNIRLFKELCGEETFKNVLVITNRWEELTDNHIGESREAQLMDDHFFGPVFAGGARRARFNNTSESARQNLLDTFSNNPLPLRIQTELVREGKRLSETVAGMTLDRELMEESDRHEREMEDLRKEIEESMRDRDAKSLQELQLTKRQLQEARERRLTAQEKLRGPSDPHMTPRGTSTDLNGVVEDVLRSVMVLGSKSSHGQPPDEGL